MPSGSSRQRVIYLLNCTGIIFIAGNRCKEPSHNFIQFDKTHMQSEIRHNLVRGPIANSQDIFSLFRSGGVDANAWWRLNADANDSSGNTLNGSATSITYG